LTTPNDEKRTRNPPTTLSHARRPPSGGAAAASAASCTLCGVDEGLVIESACEGGYACAERAAA